MRIGIVGAGVSGMVTAWLLQQDHEVTLLERAPHVGGHAETLPVAVGDRAVHAEFGARFFFDSSYPYFIGLLRLLGVPLRWSDAAVSVTDASRAHTLVLPPRAPRHVAALLRSPRHVRHVLSMRRLIEEQPAIVARRDFSVTFREHLAQRGYPDAFGREFAYPFLAACWGAPLDLLPEFPVYSLLKGMPSGKRPGFYEVEGGMTGYMRTLRAALTRVDVQLGASVRRVERHDGFRVEDERGETRRFDRLVVACSSRDAARLLRGVAGASAMESTVAAFRHFDTDIVVHGDRALMPPNPRDWSHTNLFFDGDVAWMSDWPGLREDAPVFRTWLPPGRALPSPLYGRRSYHHLVMTPENAVLQRRVAALQAEIGLWVTGMYAVDVDNHESALLSALAPAQALAPEATALRRLLGSVGPGAPHGLEVLPLPLPPDASDPSSIPPSREVVLPCS